MERGRSPPERHERLRAGVRAAAAAGHAILARGGSALDAVVAAVRVLEDDPEFNAGTGSALTRDGTVETDASVMDGATQRVGAVAAVPDLGTPIALARAVLDAGEHVILAGPAALASSPPRSGSRRRRRARCHRARADPAARRARRAHAAERAAAPSVRSRAIAPAGSPPRPRPAASSASARGRVGDSPIPGAGTWADARCAISATGDGEAILRVALARDLAGRLAAGAPLREAAAAALDALRRLTGGGAGLIAVDATGRIALQTTPAMPVAWVDADGAAGDSLGEPA